LNYKEVNIWISSEEERAILMARLESAGYESFVEEEAGLVAYIPFDAFDELILKGILGPDTAFSVVTREDRNWNEEWEKSYPSVVIADKCYIRAPFHPVRDDIPLEIIIEPKMAFGTAHHETTAMMIEWALESDFNGLKVLDMGCGTGVLAIITNKLGASDVMAVDNDEWAYRNSLENFRLNKAGNCKAVLGDASVIEGNVFDIIFANINRNILLSDIHHYSRSLKTGGLLFLSGFYEDDIPAVRSEAEKNCLEMCGKKQKSDWVAISMRKITR
jgi:ribosomal protein L11 methyltransferase